MQPGRRERGSCLGSPAWPLAPGPSELPVPHHPKGVPALPPLPHAARPGAARSRRRDSPARRVSPGLEPAAPRPPPHPRSGRGIHKQNPFLFKNEWKNCPGWERSRARRDVRDLIENVRVPSLCRETGSQHTPQI